MNIKMSFKENESKMGMSLQECFVGNDGKDGKSAYEIAIENGFEGSEVEWLESLRGLNGENGQDGFSPVINIKKTVEGHQITITHKNGQESFEIKDGITPSVDCYTKDEIDDMLGVLSSILDETMKYDITEDGD